MTLRSWLYRNDDNEYYDHHDDNKNKIVIIANSGDEDTDYDNDGDYEDVGYDCTNLLFCASVETCESRSGRKYEFRPVRACLFFFFFFFFLSAPIFLPF